MSKTVRGKGMREESMRSLETSLLDRAVACIRPPRGRFRHAWVSPVPGGGRTPLVGDGFAAGDYSAGLFHHDASEAAIELLQHDQTREAAAGGLLNLLDNAEPSGLVHRTEFAFKTRDREPAKPIIAQYALRATLALGEEWAETQKLYGRVRRFVEYWEREYTGPHGLLLTPSARATGFDNDPLSAGSPHATVEAPDTNVFMVLEYEALAELAERLGRAAEAPELRRRAASLRERIDMLLYVEDERGGFYRALRWCHGSADLDEETVAMPGQEGRVRPIESWISLLPLYAGIPDESRAERVMTRLLAEDMYWGPQGPRTVPKTSPLFSQAARVLLYDHKRGHSGPVSNWSGPVWVLSSYYLAAGLARYGREEEARQLAMTTAGLLADDLAVSGGTHECYDDEGKGLWPPGGTFVSWNILALSMLRAHRA